MIRKRAVALLLTALLLIGALAGCGERNAGGAGSWEDPPAQPDNALPEESPELVAVNTPYGDLYHQLQWSDHLETRVSEEDSRVEVSFLALIGDESYPLFRVTIGEGEGQAVGSLTDAGGTRRDVYVSMDEPPALAEEDMELLYALQEEINTVIQNLK